jgi:hypothetical protein
MKIIIKRNGKTIDSIAEYREDFIFRHGDRGILTIRHDREYVINNVWIRYDQNRHKTLEFDVQ